MLLTIDSAGQVLSLFTKDTPERGVTEVAVELGVSKSKAHALLASLTAVGLVRRTPQSRYRLGWRVMSLNGVINETTDFRTCAMPVLTSLGNRCGELVHLAVLDAGEAVCVDRVSGRHAVQIDVSSLGNRQTAHCSGAGKMLLAGLKREALDATVDRYGLPRFTARTITERAALDRELEVIRGRGYATESGETVPGVSCVAAPIVTPGPTVVAAVSLAVPTERFDERREIYSRAIVRAATYISQQLALLEAGAAHNGDPRNTAVLA